MAKCEADLNSGGSGGHISIYTTFKCQESASEIVSVNPFESWIAPVAAHKVILYNDSGEEVRQIEVDFKVQCFGVYDRKNFILSNYSGKCVYKLSHEGKLAKLVNTSPFSPNGIHVLSNDRGFVVCLVGTTGGKLVRYTQNGNSRMKTIKCDKTGLPLFKFPRRVVENLNEDLIVVDIMLKSATCVNSNGDLRWIYKGSIESRKNGLDFDPWDLACNSKEEIIISNTKSHTIDALNRDGVFLKYILTRNDGIFNPLGLTIDGEGKLWVGHAGGKVGIFNYLNDK